MQGALLAIDARITSGGQRHVTVNPAHAVINALQNPGVRVAFNASGMTTLDGMAIVWLLKPQGHKTYQGSTGRN
jgi:UDP-N-acetyl-D-mannosaminuronic acid transferase (WecB/TagA/CpsF family)